MINGLITSQKDAFRSMESFFDYHAEKKFLICFNSYFYFSRKIVLIVFSLQINQH